MERDAGSGFNVISGAKIFLIRTPKELLKKAAVDTVSGDLVGISQDAWVECLHQMDNQHWGRGPFARADDYFLAVINGIVAVDPESSTCHQGNT